jgi:hypothetical protein
VNPAGPDDLFTAVPSAHAREFDEELIVLDLKGGDYYSLNDVGSRVWQGLTTGKSCAEIARNLALSHEIAYDVALNDCLDLTNQLLEQGLLRRA